MSTQSFAGIDTFSNFQARIGRWMRETFGVRLAEDSHERALRFFEEACELVQASGLRFEQCERVLGYVFLRPVGDLAQEVGGVAVTFAALCDAAKTNLERCALVEAARIEHPETRERIRQRQEEKRAEPGLTANGRPLHRFLITGASARMIARDVRNQYPALLAEYAKEHRAGHLHAFGDGMRAVCEFLDSRGAE